MLNNCSITFIVFPPKYILVGAARWLELLATSSRSQAMQIFDASPIYSDLTMSNYLEAYEWAQRHQILTLQRPSPVQASRIFEAAVLDEVRNGTSCYSTDDMPSPGFLPIPMLSAAKSIGLSATEAWSNVIAVVGKVDLERRNRIGLLGELAVVKLLEHAGCDVLHVSTVSDALGWDITANYADSFKHLEIKSTTSSVRLRIFLSRHEYEVSCADPHWALVVVLITEDGELERVAYLQPNQLHSAVPADTAVRARWQTCSIDLRPADLIPGIPIPIDWDRRDGLVASCDDPLWWPKSAPGSINLEHEITT